MSCSRFIKENSKTIIIVSIGFFLFLIALILLIAGGVTANENVKLAGILILGIDILYALSVFLYNVYQQSRSTTYTDL